MRSLIFYTGVGIKLELLLSELELQNELTPALLYRNQQSTRADLKNALLKRATKETMMQQAQTHEYSSSRGIPHCFVNRQTLQIYYFSVYQKLIIT